MEKYKIITPKNYSYDHVSFINNIKNVIQIISSQTDYIFGIKDVFSRHIIATDSFAKIVGFDSGQDVAGKFEFEIPILEDSEYLACFKAEDEQLLHSLDIKKSLTTLKILNYKDGLKARIFKKNLLYHAESSSILGIIYAGSNIDFNEIIHHIPCSNLAINSESFIKNLGSAKNTIDYTHNLSDYEKEICFLILNEWSFKKIANFMNFYRPKSLLRTSDTIIKKRNYICRKLKLEWNNNELLCSYLNKIKFSKSPPCSLYNKMIGSMILSND